MRHSFCPDQRVSMARGMNLGNMSTDIHAAETSYLKLDHFPTQKTVINYVTNERLKNNFNINYKIHIY